MRQLFTRTLLSMAIAIFSMFFGAGNAIFPLLLGMETQGQYGWAFLGLFVTAIGGPLLGLIGATLYQGRCTDFFHRAGKIPGGILIGVTLALLGPFAVLPRCAIVSYSAVEPLISGFSLPLFASIFCAIALFCCWKRRFLLPVLGYVLSPMLIACLLFIIYRGFISDLPIEMSPYSNWNAFKIGLTTGYNTMDLIASIYFSAGIWTMVELHSGGSPSKVFQMTLKSGILSCLFLGLIYFGLVHAAAKFSPFLVGIPKEQLMTHLATVSLGPMLSIIANIAIGLACLTTVISLVMTLSEIISKEIIPQRLSYHSSLIILLLITAVMTNIGFETIMHIIHSIVSVCYPIIIVLTIVNITYKLYVKKVVKN